MKRLLLLSLLIFTACGKQQGGDLSETATYGNFELVADEVLKPVVDSLVKGFTTENPEAHVTVKYTSATEAVRLLLNHQARGILIDRMLTNAEQKLIEHDSLQLPVYKLAQDGIGCLVSSKNSATAIRLSELRKILAGEESSFGKVTLALPAYPSSIEYVLDSSLLGPDKQTAGHFLRFSTTDSIVDYVRDNPTAIGFISASWKHKLEAAGDSSVKVLPVIPHDLSSEGISEPVLLHMAYIAQGAYPLVTRVNGYSFELANTVPRGFLAYAATAHGQLVFKQFEVLPRTQPIRIVPNKQ
jgi:phosphate transport system substrate-binding protein